MNIPSTAGSFSSRSTSIVRQYFKKPTTLIVAALSAASLVLQVIAKINTSIISIIVGAIVVACLFLIYFSSTKASIKPTPFFTTLQVLSTLQVIVTALATLAFFLGGLMAILSTDTIVNALLEHPERITFLPDGFDLNNLNPELISDFVSSMKIALFIGLLVITVILAIMVIYAASQTSFLKSCKRSCKEPNLFTDGASTYGTLSIVVAVLELVLIVVAFLVLNSGDKETFEEMGIDSTKVTFTLSVPVIAYLICDAVGTFLRGSLAKGWIPFAEENRTYVAQAPVTSRSPEANPIATFKSTTRQSNDAIKQSQPYLYGEDDKNSTQKKKSSYIPEELQNDYPPQQFDQTMGGGMMNDPFMGDPFAQPMPNGDPYAQPMPNGDPFAADPFAADPFAAPQQPPMGGNPYGMPNPNDANYNNGMM